MRLKYISLVVILCLCFASCIPNLVGSSSNVDDGEDKRAGAMGYVKNEGMIQDEKAEESQNVDSILRKTFSFSEPKLVETGSGDRVEMENTDHHMNVDGYPPLPVKVYRMVLPAEREISDVNIRFSDSRSFEREVDLEPSNVGLVGDSSGKKKDLDFKYDAFPLDPIDYQVTTVRGVKILYLGIKPMGYNPSEKRVT